MNETRLIIYGAPRTLKNRGQVVLLRGGEKGQPCPYCKRKLMTPVHPSAAWREWVKEAHVWSDGRRIYRAKVAKELVTLVAPDAGVGVRWIPLAEPMNCAALFYRDANRGDRVGYEQGLYDLLQEWGIIADDALLVQGDGTRLLVDRANPRVEVTLTPLALHQLDFTEPSAAVRSGR